MESYKRGSHTVWDWKYNLVWITKYRYQVLGGDVGQRRSTVEIRAHIAAQYSLDYSHSGGIKLLARLGYEYRKPKGRSRFSWPGSCADATLS